MSENQDTPLRLLVKSYSNGLLNRDQYLKVRTELLRKLALQGSIGTDDLENFLKIYRDTDQPETGSSYSLSDWLIIILGIFAAGALAIILYG